MASSRKSNTFWTVILVLAVGIFAVCLVYLLANQYRYFSANEGYEEIADHAFDPDALSNAESSPLAKMTVDWDYLRSINPDIVAWVYYSGTRINYPVVQGQSNSTYLHTDFAYQDGFTAEGGAIFMDSGNASDCTDDTTFIYGHHMNDGSMFACLSTQLSEQSEFNAHRDFYVLTPTMNYKCRSFAIDRVPGSEAVVLRKFADEEEKETYIKDKQDRSVVQPEEGFSEPRSIDQMFALATCDYNAADSRAVLFSQVVEKAVPSADTEGAIRSEELTDAQTQMQ